LVVAQTTEATISHAWTGNNSSPPVPTARPPAAATAARWHRAWTGRAHRIAAGDRTGPPDNTGRQTGGNRCAVWEGEWLGGVGVW